MSDAYCVAVDTARFGRRQSFKGSTLQRACAIGTRLHIAPNFGTACWRRREFVWRASTRVVSVAHAFFGGVAGHVTSVGFLGVTPPRHGLRESPTSHRRVAGVMWDADLSTKVADPRLAGEVAAVGEPRRAGRSFENLSSIAAARRVLSEWMDCYLFLRAGLLTLICRHLNAGTNVAHTCSGKGSGAASPSGPRDVGSLDVGVAEFRRLLAFKLSAGDCECVKEPNGVTTAIRLFFFFRTWRDPDDQVDEWFYSGGPCGILAKLADGGVFPTTVEDGGAVGYLVSILGGSEHEFETLLADDTEAFEGVDKFVQNCHVV